MQNWVSYKLNASNPGQYYYSVIHDVGSDFSEPVTLSVTIPYPFVTQGARPVHVYSGQLVRGACVDTSGNPTSTACRSELDCDLGQQETCDMTCFSPPEQELASSDIQIAIEDYFDGPIDPRVTCEEEANLCGPDGAGSCSFDVTVPEIPPSGLLYVNVHVDYGLKGTHLDANPCNDGVEDRYDRGAIDLEFGGSKALQDTETDDGPLAIPNLEAYMFSHSDGNKEAYDIIHNVNEFKPIAGVFGMCIQSDTGDPCPQDSTVTLLDVKSGDILLNTETDEDGFYQLVYTHRGKPTVFTVRLGGSYDLEQDVELHSNGWAEVIFDIDTGTTTAEVGCGGGKGCGKK